MYVIKTQIIVEIKTHTCISNLVRPNNLSCVSIFALYISFLLFGHFFLDTLSRKKRKYIMTNIDTQEADYSVYTFSVHEAFRYAQNQKIGKSIRLYWYLFICTVTYRAKTQTNEKMQR